jgi:hypothetical protein
MKEVIIFRIFYWNEFIEKQLRTLVKNSPHEVVVIQDTTYDEPAKTDLCRVFTCDYQSYKDFGYPLPTEEDIDSYGEPPERGRLNRYAYYNVEYPMVAFAMMNDYDYYWHWEYDLMWYGDYAHLWELCDTEADLLSLFLLQYPAGRMSNIAWRYNSMGIPMDRMFRQFGALWRGSKRLMRMIHKMLRMGFHNHSEQLVPTVAVMNDFKVVDFNKLGSGKVYDIDTVHTPFSEHTKESDTWNKLYHPIKKEDDIYTKIRDFRAGFWDAGN